MFVFAYQMYMFIMYFVLMYVLLLKKNVETNSPEKREWGGREKERKKEKGSLFMNVPVFFKTVFILPSLSS